MLTVFETFIASLTGAILLFFQVWLLTPLARKVNLVDRSDHGQRFGFSVPTLGGLAIYSSVVFVSIVWPMGEWATLVIFFSGVIVAIGLLDDLNGLGIKTRLLLQTGVSLAMLVNAQLWVTSLGKELEFFDPIFGSLGLPLTTFALVGLINAYNMLDGIDGLASGQFVITALSLGLAIVFEESSGGAYQPLIIVCAIVLAFWLVNVGVTPLCPVYLGDSGSTLLGLLTGWILIAWTQSDLPQILPIAALWCVFLPIADTISVVISRLLGGLSPFHGDRRHLHHKLLDCGYSRYQVLGFLLVFSLSVNFTGIAVTYLGSQVLGICTFILLVTVFSYVSNRQVNFKR